MNKNEVKPGYYPMKPVACGMSVSKKGVPQFILEFEVTVGKPGETVKLQKYSSLNNDEYLDYTFKDAELCGCDTGKLMKDWRVDPKRQLEGKVVVDEYGPKVKGIYPQDNTPGASLKRMAPKAEEMDAISLDIQERIRRLRNPAPAPSFGGPPVDDKDDIAF